MITKLEDQVNETKKHVVDLNKKEKELKGTFNIHKSNVAELEAEKRRANQKVWKRIKIIKTIFIFRFQAWEQKRSRLKNMLLFKKKKLR